MGDPIHDLEAEALELPREQRARLAVRLISSLDPGTDSEAESAWLEEADRRLEELESGRRAGVPAAGAFERVRSSLR